MEIDNSNNNNNNNNIPDFEFIESFQIWDNKIEYLKNVYKGYYKINSDSDYIIYDLDSIPECSICLKMYNDFKNIKDAKQIKAYHSSCGCLWFPWFKQKLLSINPNIVFYSK